MSFGGELLSASLVTVELLPAGARTQMTFTEQAVFLGGEGAREQRVLGTGQGFDRLAQAIAGEAVVAR